ncbi:hypothetical protein [Amycolatopsis sp. NPDC021455]|uniref:hypothetical protein n=1 Tax=Amycolatopsis sp. NPDC021455 TaxID=3154901 RepID=UPI0033F5EE9B
MRGDWIHDWVLVEMDYRAGTPSRVAAVRAEERRPPSKPWRALWATLFPPHRAGVSCP